jgi:hypothetical protein
VIDFPGIELVDGDFGPLAVQQAPERGVVEAEGSPVDVIPAKVDLLHHGLAIITNGMGKAFRRRTYGFMFIHALLFLFNGGGGDQLVQTGIEALPITVDGNLRAVAILTPHGDGEGLGMDLMGTGFDFAAKVERVTGLPAGLHHAVASPSMG